MANQKYKEGVKKGIFDNSKRFQLKAPFHEDDYKKEEGEVKVDKKQKWWKKGGGRVLPIILSAGVMLSPSVYSTYAGSNSAKTSQQVENKVDPKAIEDKYKIYENKYFTYNIYNILKLLTDVKYDDKEMEKKTAALLAKDAYNIIPGAFIDKPLVMMDVYDEVVKDDEERYEKFAYSREKIKWEALEKIYPGITLEGRKKYFKKMMEIACKGFDISELFNTYKIAKKLEITDKVFQGIKWPEIIFNEKNKLYEGALDLFYGEGADGYRELAEYTRYRIGGARLDLRAGQKVIAPPASIIFDVERGQFFAEDPWGMSTNDENVWDTRRFVHLKIGPLYIQFNEWFTYTNLTKFLDYRKFFEKGQGVYVLVQPFDHASPNVYIEHIKTYYNTIYPKVKEAFNDMKFVRIFSIQMFKDDPSIRAYAVMIPPGVDAGVRSADQQITFQKTQRRLRKDYIAYVKNTLDELDNISGKQPNIKETCIRKERRDPNQYTDWRMKFGYEFPHNYYGALFLVYPTKTDGTEWVAELFGASRASIARGGIGAVFPYNYFEVDPNTDGHIFSIATAPDHWNAVLKENPNLIIDDYINALTRTHFNFTIEGFYKFEKDNGNIRLVEIHWCSLYPKVIEDKMKALLKEASE